MFELVATAVAQLAAVVAAYAALLALWAWAVESEERHGHP